MIKFYTNFKQLWTFLLLGLVSTLGVDVFGQTNPTPQTIPYSQDFAAYTGSTTSYLAGWQGWTHGTTALNTTFLTAAPVGNQAQAAGTNSATGGVFDCNGKISFLSTATGQRSICLAINTTGFSTVNVSYLAQTQYQLAGGRINEIGVQYRVGTSGTFTDISSSTYQNNASVANTTGTAGINPSTISFSLPAPALNEAVVQLRWIIRDVSGTGNRPGFSLDDISITGTGIGSPALSVGALTPAGTFSTTTGTPSANKTFTISGSSLTNPVNVTVVAGYEYSTNGGGSWTSSNFSFPGPSVSETVTVRLTGAAPGTFNGSVAISSTGASGSPASVVTNGTVSPPSPILSTSGTLTKFYANNGITSDVQIFTVSGSFLSADAVVGPLAGYEFSSLFAGPYSNSINLANGGTLTNVPVYVRIKGNPGAPAVGAVSGNIPVSSTGATTVNVAAVGEVFQNGSSFTDGNIVALRVGDGLAALTSASTPTFITEFTSAGTSVQTFPLPLSANGSAARMGLSGTGTAESFISLSPDGKYLSLTGYDAPIGTAAVSGTAPSSTNRVVGLLENNGVVNSTTKLDNLTGAFRSAVTLDGSGFWVSAASGIGYVPFGNSGNANILSTLNSRVVVRSNSDVWVSSGSGINIGLNKVGTGSPTSGIQTVSLQFGGPPADPYSFVLLDRDATVPGNDVAYVAANAGGIQKYSFNGTSWTARGTLTGTSTSITGKVIGGNVELYYTVGTGAANTIRRLVDNTAYNANIVSNGSALATVGTLVATAPANTAFRGVAFAPVAVPQSDVAHFLENPTPTNIAQGDAQAVVYGMRIETATANALLNSVSFTTSGTYTASDVENFRLYISNDATWDPSDVLLGTKATPTGSGETLSFTGIGQNIPVDATRYLFVTTSVSGCATIGRTVIVTTSTANINYSAANKLGTLGAGSTYSVVAGTLANPTAVVPSNSGAGVQLDWVNPSCLDDIVIIASTTPIVGTPSGVFSSNSDYTLAPTLPGVGKVVYVGSSSPQVITGLTLGTNYYFKLFTRRTGLYSTGVQVSIIPQITGLFSRGSGNISDPIWALTSNGTPATAASLGGFGINKNIIIQSGHVVSLNTSPLNARDIIVNAGGQLIATGTGTGDMKYINLFGSITNNGEIGTGATFNPIGLNIEGANCLVTGTGNTNLGRVRKNGSANLTSVFRTNRAVNIRFFGGTALYNASPNTTLQVNVLNGGNLSITDPTGTVALDGNDFAGPDPAEIRTNLQISGQMNIAGRLNGRNNNTTPGFGCAVTINAGGRLNVGSLLADVNGGQGTVFTLNGPLNVTGDATFESGVFPANGNLYIKSGPSGTARIANSAGTISGSLVAERYVSTGGWHFTGTALAGQTISDWNDDFNTQGPMPGVQTYNPGSNTSSIFEFDESYNVNDGLGEINGWKVPTTSALVQGKGYRVFIPANKLLDNTGAYTMNPGPISVANSGATPYSGWNLITNPHLSAVNPSSFTLGSGVQNTIVLWNPNTQQYEYTGTLGSITGVTLNNSISPIASGQAFFMFTTSNSTVTIPQSAKTIGGTFFRSNSTQTGMEIQLMKGDKKDATVFQFIENSSAAYEPSLDAMKMQNPGINIFTLSSDQKKLAIQGLPFEQETTVLPIGFTATETGAYQLNFLGTNLLNGPAAVYLRDNENGTLTAIEDQDVYSFTVNATGTNLTRFELIFTQSVTQTGGLNVQTKSASVVPNPVSSSSFTIQTQNLTGMVRFELLDILGKTLETKEINLNRSLEQVKFSSPSKSGQYILKISGEKFSATKQIIIQ